MQMKDGTLRKGELDELMRARKTLEGPGEELTKKAERARGYYEYPIYAVGGVVRVLDPDGRTGHFRVRAMGKRQMRLKSITRAQFDRATEELTNS